MKQRDFVLLFGSSCIVVLAWIGFTLYNKTVTSTINENVIVSVKPITDSFDIATLERVKSKLQVQPLYSVTAPLSPTPSPVISGTPKTSITPTPITPVTNAASTSAGVRI